MAIYVVQGKVISRTNGQPVPATIEVFEVDPLGGNYKVDPLVTTPSPIITDINGNFKASFNFAGPGKPDIIFRVSQKVSGMTKYIYSENPAFDTRWNIADVLYNTLKVEGDIITLNPSPTGQPVGNYFIFTRVGNIPVSDISQTNGYAYPDINPNPPNSMDSNQPFGGTLWIGGWFGKALLSSTQLKYYKIQYAAGLHSPVDPGPWFDIYDPLVNYRYDVADQQWVTESMGPVSDSGIANLYKLPWNTDTIPWSFPDVLITWDTTKITAGLYTLRVLGYRVYSGALQQFSPNPDPSYGALKLDLDNTPPSLQIKSIKHNGSIIGPCNKIDFKGGKISMEFEAYDPKGHLRLYSLNAFYGHNQVVTPPPITPNKAHDDYSAHVNATQKWQGSISYITEYYATPPAPDAVGYNIAEMPTCAYQFRLRADKRTTNGYGLVYWGYEDNFHVFIER